MFCQSCGAQNAVEARFCNMCGAGLSPQSAGSTLRSAGGGAPVSPAPGSPAPGGTASLGPVPVGTARVGQAPAGPPLGQMPSPYDPGASSVSLQSIGVQSSARTWTLIGGIVVVLLLLGGVAGWLTKGGEAPAAPVVPPDAIAAPMEIGTPTAVGEDVPSTEPPPRGLEPPTGVMPGGGSGRRVTPGAQGTTGRGASPTQGTTPGTTPGAAHTARPNAASTGGAAGTAQAHTGPSGAGTGNSGAAGTGHSGAAGAVAEPVADPAAGTDPPNTVPMDDPVDERDLMLDLYATQVRRFIRTYYATRAQSCFDHASRNNEGIRGTVVVTFTIAADGLIPAARATRNTTGDDALAGCLVAQVRAWDLPDPPGGELELAMPFSR